MPSVSIPFAEHRNKLTMDGIQYKRLGKKIYAEKTG